MRHSANIQRRILKTVLERRDLSRATRAELVAQGALAVTAILDSAAKLETIATEARAHAVRLEARLAEAESQLEAAAGDEPPALRLAKGR